MTKILLGTYTRRISEGIYEITLDENNQELKDLNLVVKTQNPTYLDFDEESKTLFSVYQENDKAGIAVYHFEDDKAELEYTRINEGVQPCYVSYHKNEGSIYEANYHAGSITVTRDKKEDRVIEYAKGSHAHFIDFDPKTDDVFVCDLGLDTVRKYRLMNEIATYKTADGMGPRHLVFHPTEPYIYIFGELNNTIDVVRDEDFDLVHVQTINTLPEEGIKSSGGAIRISNDGKFVYASNRGHDSIAVFKVNDDYTLELVEHIPTEGEHPRDFNLTPDNKFMVVANMITDNLSLFARDVETGKLTLLQKDVHAPEPVCVLFL
ncbi:lactonase family protein [Erysipelothrix sp. HDW6A]|uniref:lactonase family protein n=1 Tax=Erysipelothrix sp. HDW6A TaxID=2714928 RepID=UPI001407ECC9|nr:lactonase family protein [Erysipelothrix sp. HDW6A]QIK57830.1 lactonase family protein [Erysipelothrix sp. HDW6A]